MVKFIEVDPNDIPNFSDKHRGRVSYPILKTFLETGLVCAQLDRTGIQQSKTTLYPMLGSYIKRHSLPIKIFSRAGEFYLMRLDLDAEGKPLLNASEALAGWESGEVAEVEALPITTDEINHRQASAPG